MSRGYGYGYIYECNGISNVRYIYLRDVKTIDFIGYYIICLAVI